MQILIVWGLVEALWGYAQLLGILPSLNGRFLMTGSFFNPGPYCAFLGCIIPAAVYMVVGKRNRAEEIGGWIYLVTAVPLMPVLMGRTGWLAAAVGSLVVWWFSSAKHDYPARWRNGRILAVSFVLMIISGVVLYLLKPASALGRVFIWMMAANAVWHDSGVTGVGWEHVGAAIGNAQERYFATHPDSVFATVAGSPEYAFNEFLQIGLADGYLMLLLFIFIPLALVCIAYKSRNYGILGVWIALLITCLGSYPLQFASFRALFGVLTLLTLLHWILHVANRERNHFRHSRWIYKYGILATVTIVGAATAWFVDATPKEERTAEILFERGRALRRIEKFEQSNEVLSEGLTYSGDPMFLNLIGRNMEDMHRCGEAEVYYRRSINRLPSRLYPYYRLCKMFAEGECRDSVKFREVCERAMCLDIKVPSPATDSMLSELKTLRRD